MGVVIKYVFSQPFKIVDTYYLIPFEKGPMTEYLVFKIQDYSSLKVLTF